MACPIGKDEVEKLKVFLEFCSANPQTLHLPQLSFFKSFIEKFGGKLPEKVADETKPSDSKTSVPPTTPPPKTKTPESEPEPESESEPESDVDIDMEGCIEPDEDEPQKMGDTTKEPTEQEMDESSEFRGKAARAFSDGNYDEAINFYTEAIMMNPTNALFYAKRGQTYLKLNKPNACIRDCDRALEINCDSAAAYKFRGRANRLLGNWEAAAKDLRQACKLDYDDDADEWLREVTPNAKKIEQHRIKQERKAAEKEIKARRERIRKANAANEAAAAAAAGGDTSNDSSTWGNAGNFFDSETANLFKDPEVKQAMDDIQKNPGNVMNYLNNPKIMNLLTKIAGPGMTGAFNNMASGGGTQKTSTDKKPDFKEDDVE